MFSFVRSGVATVGADLGTGFCALAPSQLNSATASKAKTHVILFMAAVLLEVRAFRAFIYPDTAATTSVHFKLSSGIISTSLRL
jgi:hypothetical protein